MERKVFFVLGGESTGTRLTTRLLVDAGCFGDVDHTQRIDEWAYKHVGSLEERLQKGQPLVWRRSFPYGEKYPDIMKDLVDPMFRLYGVNHDDDVMFLVTMRNWLCAAKSAVAARHCDTKEEAINRLKFAYVKIFSFFAKIVRYQSLIAFHALAMQDQDQFSVSQVL